MQKTRASRGAKAGLELSAVAADKLVDIATPLALQASILSRRYGQSPALAAVRAEHCFGVPESWRGAR